MSAARTVVVVGAGIAGLTAALTLAEAGARVELFEAGRVPGGRLSCGGRHTVTHRGIAGEFGMEHGVHGIWRRYVNLRRLLGRLGLDLALRDPGEQALVVRREDGAPGFVEIGAAVRQSRLPAAIASASMLPPREILRSPRLFLPRIDRVRRPMNRLMAFDPRYDVATADQDDVRAFISDFPPGLQQMMRSMTHSGFFAEPDQVSLAAFFTGLWFYGVSDKQACGFEMLAEDGGAAIVEPLWRRVEALGGRGWLGHRVRGVEWDGPATLRAVYAEGPDGPMRLPVDAVVFAVDPPALAGIIGEGGRLAELLASYALPRGVPSVVTRLWFATAPDPRRPFTGIFGEGAADNYFWLHRFMRPYRAWHRATGGSAVECHLYGDRVTGAAGAPDEAVLDGVERLIRWGWPEVGARIAGHVLRNPATHVAFAPGTMSRLPPVAPGPPALALCGDWIACPEPVLYLERACLTGLLAAQSVAPVLGLAPTALPAVIPQPPPAPSVAAVRGLLRLGRRRRDEARV
ncbi:MAG: FAD-dependent oxidoreductase [Myxococcales bacterium]|nr:FAD-dependent oxidoreductase [Myxococcales bacterium]